MLLQDLINPMLTSPFKAVRRRSLFNTVGVLNPFSTLSNLSPFSAVGRWLSPFSVAGRWLSPFSAVGRRLSPFSAAGRRTPFRAVGRRSSFNAVTECSQVLHRRDKSMRNSKIFSFRTAILNQYTLFCQNLLRLTCSIVKIFEVSKEQKK